MSRALGLIALFLLVPQAAAQEVKDLDKFLEEVRATAT